ncbi:7-cyano-7-deazaguanine synthase QueC [Myxococcota bacterium]|nr:7-cyano-7-deazaguanine synthase QueC [Myxococcota bacterium]MBU1432213.1 7-cyano-7-deazaguanine synthase QueC [Myxococcota bacterium]MBU1900416.1 7-cyano-7-deazaguanine synthase QueC [Myxococcota bacterium]
MRRAIVLTSGGLDSTTCLAVARAQGFEAITALTFRYGQLHAQELEAAAAVAAHYDAEQITFEVDLFDKIGGSSLVGDGEVPKDRSAEEMSAGVPSTYVPARNLLFLAYAVAVAEVRGAEDIFIGVNAVDYSGYPDCRPEFIERFTDAARYATRFSLEDKPLRIQTPLIALTKAEIVAMALRLGAPLALTHTCYAPTAEGACGACDACLLRLKGFADAGAVDPIRYAAR